MNRYTEHTAECELCRRAVGTADTEEGAGRVLTSHWSAVHGRFSIGAVRSVGPESIRLTPITLLGDLVPTLPSPA